jgi:hypothetical protein
MENEDGCTQGSSRRVGGMRVQLMEAGMNVFKGCDAPTQADSGRADTFQREEG